MPSASANIIAETLRSRRPRWSWRRSPARTSRIFLGSAVTVLSTDDPVRVFQRFSTLNAISNGRAEVILGRGSFTESYPLFGYDMAQYEQLFEEKLELFAALLANGPVTWSGRTRAALTGQIVYPPIESGALRTWVGVGGSPESVVRAARYGLPLTLAIIGGSPTRFRPYVDLYHQSLERFGFEPPADRRAFTRTRGGDGPGSERAAVAALPGDDDPHRRRARMAAGHARAVRS